ncbi:hypothetical protein KCP74_02430 [Salmonella enterica subsp. enterica]|nr:hypothetical protein KCP74_02430 [Salmonella enterica subsp. enterica]
MKLTDCIALSGFPFPPLNSLNEYAIGTHFIDTLSGKWRFSAELKNADSIDATARSAHGRFFFMLRLVVKSPQVREPKSISGKSPAQRKLHHYNVQKYCGLAGMAFSWQGKYSDSGWIATMGARKTSRRIR